MKLLDQVRGVLRAKHYAYRTEQCYVQWIIRYIRFFGVKHPNTMGTSEIEQFLTQPKSLRTEWHCRLAALELGRMAGTGRAPG